MAMGETVAALQGARSALSGALSLVRDVIALGRSAQTHEAHLAVAAANVEEKQAQARLAIAAALDLEQQASKIAAEIQLMLADSHRQEALAARYLAEASRISAEVGVLMARARWLNARAEFVERRTSLLPHARAPQMIEGECVEIKSGAEVGVMVPPA